MFWIVPWQAEALCGIYKKRLVSLDGPCFRQQTLSSDKTILLVYPQLQITKLPEGSSLDSGSNEGMLRRCLHPFPGPRTLGTILLLHVSYFDLPSGSVLAPRMRRPGPASSCRGVDGTCAKRAKLASYLLVRLRQSRWTGTRKPCPLPGEQDAVTWFQNPCSSDAF